MPITPTYPGVYVLELPSSTHTISGVSTANTAFIDFFSQGPVGKATQINSFTEFHRDFGGLDARSEAAYQIMQYYNNGGKVAYVVRVVPIDAMQATVDTVPANAIFPGGGLTLGYGESVKFTTNMEGRVVYSLSDSSLATLVQTKNTAVLTVKPPPGKAVATAAAARVKRARDFVKAATLATLDSTRDVRQAITQANVAIQAARDASDAALANAQLPTEVAAQSAVVLSAAASRAATAAARVAKVSLADPDKAASADDVTEAQTAAAALDGLKATGDAARAAYAAARDALDTAAKASRESDEADRIVRAARLKARKMTEAADGADAKDPSKAQMTTDAQAANANATANAALSEKIAAAAQAAVAAANRATDAASAAQMAAGFPDTLKQASAAADASGPAAADAAQLANAARTAAKLIMVPPDQPDATAAATAALDAAIALGIDKENPGKTANTDAADAARDAAMGAVAKSLKGADSVALEALRPKTVTVTVWSERACTNCDACSDCPNCCTINIVPPEIGAPSPAEIEVTAAGQHALFTATMRHGLQGVRWILEDENGNPVDDSYGTIDPAKGVYIGPRRLPAVRSRCYAIPHSADEDFVRAAVGAEIVLQAAGPALSLRTTNSTIALGKSALVVASYNGEDLDPDDVSWTLLHEEGEGDNEDLGTGSPFCYVPAENVKSPVTLRASWTDEDGDAVQGEIVINVGTPAIMGPEEWTDDVNTHKVQVGHGIQFRMMAGGGEFISPDTVWSLKSGHGILDAAGFYKAPTGMPADSPMVVVQSSTPIETPDGTETIVESIVFKLVSAETRLTINAANPGAWGNSLEAVVYQSPAQVFDRLFNFQVRLLDILGNVVANESYQALNWDPEDSQYCLSVVNSVSKLVHLVDNGADKEDPYYYPGRLVPDEGPWLPLKGGTDGHWQTGEFAQSIIDMLDPDGSPLTVIAPNIFNLLAIPATATMDAGSASAITVAAAQLCVVQRALLIIDVPPAQTVPNPEVMIGWFEGLPLNLQQKGCAATYWPRIEIPDPLKNFRPREVGTSGTMAGIYAAMDVNRGVWKAPAGIAAGLAGAHPVYTMKDSENGKLNPLGINAIRNFPVYGVVSWGARTLAGADDLADQWKYIPVRRLAQYIENTLFNGLKWAVFEPNDEPLWAAIRLNVGAFMNSLFGQGAFQGSSPGDAFFVKCGADTTQQYDIDRGIVNVVVGFAPLKPAEFVIVQIEQISGQSS